MCVSFLTTHLPAVSGSLGRAACIRKYPPKWGGVRWPFSRLHMVPGPESAIGRSKLHFRIFEEVEDRMFVVKQ